MSKCLQGPRGDAGPAGPKGGKGITVRKSLKHPNTH